VPEAIGHGAFQPSAYAPRPEKAAEQAKAINARQSEAVAETVQRQADFSSSRADYLTRQAEQLENRAQARDPGKGLGGQVDISV